MKACPACGRMYPEDAGFCPVDGQALTSATQVPVASDEHDPRVGQLVAGRYQIRRVVADGGMGRVYEGLDTHERRNVALKILHPEVVSDAIAVERFKREFEVSKQLPHEHIVDVLDFVPSGDGSYALVMEFLYGEELRNTLKREHVISPGRLVRMLSQAALALDVAHERKLVHRDLKPDNILLARDPEAGRLGYTVKLVDFGIAKLVHDEAATGAAATQAGAVLGTPHFMSPEALTASSPVTAASDVWSLGACAFAAVCGRVPFEGDAIGDVVLKVCAAPMPVPSASAPRVPRAFDAWFARSCAREPKQRFASAGEAARALRELERWAGAERERGTFELAPAAALDLELPEPRPSSRGVLLAGLLVGAAVTLGSLGALVYVRTEQANRAMAATAASANAAIEAANERKLAEADQAFWEAGAPEASAPTPPPRPPRQPSRVER